MRGLIAFCVVFFIVAIAAAVYELWPRDSVSKESVNRSVVLFRKDMQRAAAYPKHPGADIPPLGVYQYKSRGSESLDANAFSTGHNYGGTTTVSLIPIRCGVTERWQPLVERWTEGDLCVKPTTSRVVAIREYHEFFDKSKLSSYRCAGGTTPYAPALRVGMTWHTLCTSDSGTIKTTIAVVGTDKVDVAGKPLDAVHLRSQSILSGDPDGTAQRDSWIRRSDGLLLKRIGTSKAHVDASGGGDFSENYEIDLISTKPQR